MANCQRRRYSFSLRVVLFWSRLLIEIHEAANSSVFKLKMDPILAIVFHMFNVLQHTLTVFVLQQFVIDVSIII